MSRHINIPIFIPHMGCPQACVFCNQKKISGVKSFSLDSVKEQIERVLSSTGDNDEVEIAFFGGSFTAIDRELMIRLLEIGESYLKSGQVSALRCSTRPDAITREILDILKAHGMRTIEIGVQSMSDGVLSGSKRGHTAEDSVRACALIREYGFSLVCQMMLGLPGSTLEDEMETARKIVCMGADAARIYPTVVFRESELCKMAMDGEYMPLTEDEAVLRGSEVVSIFRDGGVPVIRIGLCSSENLSSRDEVYGGANHPALGELILGEVYYKRMCELIAQQDMDAIEICFAVNYGELSLAVGHKKKNKKRLLDLLSPRRIRFVEDRLPPGQIVSIR